MLPLAEKTASHLEEKANAIRETVTGFYLNNKKLMLTSSFQTHSIPLLHIISSLPFKIPVYFLDTGYLFPETYAYKNQIADFLALNVISLESVFDKKNQIDNKSCFLYMTNPDKCCHINKVLPLEPVLQQFDIWINGVRKSQSSTRNELQELQESANGILRYHPILDWTARDIYFYAKQHQLPPHPLNEKGYRSIGCIPCTSKYIEENNTIDNRLGRWQGMNKTECGLHTTLGAKK